MEFRDLAPFEEFAYIGRDVNGKITCMSLRCVKLTSRSARRYFEKEKFKTTAYREVRRLEYLEE